jgi:uncharacterized membrane protein
VSTRTDEPERAHPRRLPGPRVWLALAVAAYVLGFWQAACLRHLNFHFNQDAANFNHMLWRTAHGDFLPSYLYGRCHLGDHASFFLLMLVPLYALRPAMSTLLLLQSAAIGASALPMFLIARRRLRGEWLALAAALAYLFHPGIVSQNLNQVHEVQFVIGFFLMAFFCLETDKFAAYAAFCVLAATGKETVALSLFFLGAYALALRRPWKWVLFPMLFAALYMAVVVGLVMPAFWGAGYRHWYHFHPYGQTAGEVARNLVLNPSLTFSMAFTGHKLRYLVELLMPCGFALPFMGPAALVALPDLLVNLVSAEPAFAVVEWHYSVIISAFLCVAAVQAIGRMADAAGRRPRLRQAAWMLGWLTLTALSWPSWATVSRTAPPPDLDQRLAVLEQVPADPRVSVVAPQTLVAHLTERYTILTPEQTWTDLSRVDVVVIDQRDPSFGPAERERMRDALNQGGHRLVWTVKHWSVFRRPTALTPASGP